jgi:uncharacterized protein (DUF4213/DUF364 family)
MTLIDQLLAGLTEDAALRCVLVGAHWTAVCSRRCGLASTIIGDQPHGHSPVRDVGRLHLKSAFELAEYARSDVPLEASLGVAAINSLLEVDQTRAVEINAAEVLARSGHDKTVVVIGHFPFITKLRPEVKRLWVIEQRPTADEYPAEAADNLLPQADVVAITGTTLINGTLDRLLAACRSDALVMMFGPTTPLSPVLFDHGVSLLAGAMVVDEIAAMNTIRQGATFQQVAGVRLLTLARTEKDLAWTSA